jgi:diguanylate cyclase (GGDEF)-like protein
MPLGEGHLTLASSDSGQRRNALGWSQVRLSVVVLIGIIVAVAIACVVMAVLGSARRADEFAYSQERQLLIRAFTNRGEWILRRLDNVVAADEADPRRASDVAWLQHRAGLWFKALMDLKAVIVANPNDALIEASVDAGPGTVWTDASIPELAPVLDYMRGRTTTFARGIVVVRDGPTERGRVDRAAFLQVMKGRFAIVAARAVVPATTALGREVDHRNILLAVSFVNDDMLADFSDRLQLPSLRQVNLRAPTTTDHTLDFVDNGGQTIGRIAWTSKRPGAEIVTSVVPFIAIALVGFALLATLVVRHMRRTAATIAAGESRLRHLALHDPLCGLPNRIFFGERLETVIEQVRKGSPAAAVFYIDLDHFKDVNDTLGHPTGDELIRAVTQRLSRTLRGDDLVARIGGDEFAVITCAAFDHATLQGIANRLIAALCAPYTINNKTIVIGASMGIAVIHEHIAGAADIMRHADMALYRAKNEGRNRACIYDTAMDTDLLKRKLVENDLRAAIDKDELHLDYQPIVNNSGETVVGVEALCRWTHPVRGEIAPSEFIPIAENSGLIIELGEWVLRRACLDGKAWPGVTVSVNVSPLQFRRADFVDVVERILAETEFNPTQLELEVTESTLLGNVETAELAMFRLKALGVRLALDDFGTGYSSLLYLRRFPFDKLKIDRSFVLSIERAADAAAIVHAVVSLGRGLGMKVTAEGVETAEQHLFLRAAGVHSMQGYRFGRPGTAAAISARLASPESFQIADDPPSLALAG